MREFGELNDLIISFESNARPNWPLTFDLFAIFNDCRDLRKICAYEEMHSY